MLRFHKKSRKGQAMVEFAVVLPLILIFLSGTIDVGYMYQQYLTLQNAAREGARLGAVGASYSSVSSRVSEVMGDHWSGVSVSIVMEEIDQGDWDEIRVTVLAPVMPLTSLISLIPVLSDGVTARAVAAFRKE